MSDARQAAEAMREAAAKVAGGFLTGPICPYGNDKPGGSTWDHTEADICPVCKKNAEESLHTCVQTHSGRIAFAIRAIPLPEDAPDPHDDAAIDDIRQLLATRDATIARLSSELADVKSKLYVPGRWRCPKCNFGLMQMSLRASDGAVGARDDPDEKCPNCDTPLWRVTEREAGDELAERCQEYLQRASEAISNSGRFGDD